MISTFLFLIIFQLLGEVIVYGLALPIPGQVIGMVLLLAYFHLREGAASKHEQTIPKILKHLSLFFIPAGTGIVVYLSQVKSNWLVIASAVSLSTAVALAITALAISRVGRSENAR